MSEVIHTDQAPAAIGPYVQARRVGPWLYTSGQIALNPQSGDMVGADAASQATQVMKNLAAVLSAGGACKENVIKTTIFLVDMADFASVNQIYGDFFGEHRPARSTVAVAQLPKGALVEIECVAFIS
ncbi:MAG: RidA family protein [Acidobacteria bacterium]|nr:RidA family protein [Acidobacteriota bacterium]